MKSYSLGDIAGQLNLQLIGDPDCPIKGLGTLASAGAGEISFLSNSSYLGQLASTSASAVIVEARHADAAPTSVLIAEHPYVAFAHLSQLFAELPSVEAGVHASASVAASASLGEGVCIGANAVIEDDVEIGANSAIGPGTVVGRGVRLGENCRLHAQVTLYHGVQIGSRVTVHSQAVIGADGFGFAFDGTRRVKIQQLGSVQIGDDVDIGAGTTIDRGAIEDTIVEHGVKIDNQVQIGHNCYIGAHTVICGCTAIAGSARIGKYCILGGASGMVGHLSLADGVQVSAMSLVNKSITEPGTYSSGTGQMKTADWKRAIVRFQQLEGIVRRLKELEKLVGADD
ncbi:MAG TPA: UDP-3-O-(3-hydroxymyristoyl)glucosamine N-acyltransferase [Gammaproteobacteria bacterium]|nr:UDP-3-O-(3-hydroxymyristoyl)glucosamine N-acyltransferase [Gammaproteobacteria bacterium]